MFSQTSKIIQEPFSLAHAKAYFLYISLTLGAFKFVCVLHHTLFVLAQTFILSGTSLTEFGSDQGAWAVVTGCTDGIGKEFARQLAEAGFNMLLVARNIDRLNSTAQEIEFKYGVKTRVHAVDFGKADDETYAELTETLKRYDIGVLVNNVGTSWQFARFVETPLNKINDMIQINVNSLVRVTYAVLPRMIKRKRGLVLNVGSLSGEIPAPMLATYSSTKAFLATFTRAIAEEVRHDGVMVENLNAYYVVSKLSGFRKSSILVPTAEAYVRSALSKIGLPCGSAYSGRSNTSSPYWSHALFEWLVTPLVRSFPAISISVVHEMHKRALRRAAKGKAG
ncbi:hypothetical protein NP233_g8812 [Leucocoprinus birnbaumii]|uniref:Very-long-chain 3-oxoacyl-CoA reductase n=1 Tax=Leucocoprinus birnbaumii TaxID=56174 RepID=A0AAD5YRH3_9AGAR|nr:hypothetical protein NP233_g8812 [Leucocoprinus birnbaumii]